MTSEATLVGAFPLIIILINVPNCLCIFPQLAPTTSASLVNSMKIVENPVGVCDQVYTLIQSLTAQIRKRMEDPTSAGEWKTAVPVASDE